MNTQIKPKLKRLSTQMITQCIKMFVDSFLKQNLLWKKLGITEQQAEQDLKLKFKYAANSSTSFVMIDENKEQIIAVTITIDILDYRSYLNQVRMKKQRLNILQQKNKYPQKINNKGIYVLEKYGIIAEQSIFESIGANYEPNKYLYNFGAATSPTYSRSKISASFWYQVTQYYKYKGYTAIFCRASTRQTTKMMIKLGGIVLKETQLFQEGTKGQKLQIIRLDFKIKPKL